MVLERHARKGQGDVIMYVASIGFVREDGDFELLATLNNSAGHLPTEVFDGLVEKTVGLFRSEGIEVEALEREDAPDVVSIEGVPHAN